MAAIVLFVFALLLLGLGGLLYRRTSPYSQSGGDAYNRRQTRKLVAQVLLIAGVLVLIMAGFGLFVQSGP
jgi:ABC-type Fe3+ transport system permease subunit